MIEKYNEKDLIKDISNIQKTYKIQKEKLKEQVNTNIDNLLKLLEDKYYMKRDTSVMLKIIDINFNLKEQVLKCYCVSTNNDDITFSKQYLSINEFIENYELKDYRDSVSILLNIFKTIRKDFKREGFV
jgi:hypothetical protein